MTRIMPFAVGTALLSLALTFNGRAGGLPAGQVDFGTFTPPSGGAQFVEVNLTSNLISLAAKLVEKQEPDVAQLLNGLQMVSVHVIGLTDENRDDIKDRMEKTRKELLTKGWDRIVAARQEGKDVGIYLKTQNKDTVQGLVVTVLDGNEHAVFINIVGDIKPEKLALLGERLHIDPLKNLPKPDEK
ncbi:MAG TPA: DUF4252 domain-containing protein [Verrucomicrobiae bacterium]|nr:DUF4252 domain-containing protein [Verrucomicrobiae bacterium]